MERMPFSQLCPLSTRKSGGEVRFSKIRRNLSGYEILYEWNDDVVANLVGTCDDSFIATITSKSDPTKTEWISISQERVLKDNLLGDEKESNITSYTIYDGIMYYTKKNLPPFTAMIFSMMFILKASKLMSMKIFFPLVQ